MMRLAREQGSLYLWEEDSRIYLRWRSASCWDDVRVSLKATFFTHGTLSYDGARKLWSVPSWKREALEQWAYRTFDAPCIEWGDGEVGGFSSHSRARHNDHERQHDAQDAPEPALVGAYRALCLTPDAPPDLVQTAYRWWAKQTHPDHNGGDGQSMAAVNSAVAIIRAHGRTA